MRQHKGLTPGIILVVFSSLITFVMLKMTYIKHEELYESQLKRYSSYILADQLRQSSDDLTRMARTYVITENEMYEKMYQDILAIRNGEKPYPEHMERIYWDLVLKYGDKPKPDTNAVPLRKLMRKAGFSHDEFFLLNLAQRNSDKLVVTERIAMNAVKGLYEDENGEFTVTREPDTEYAQRLMHDAEYHSQKAQIMLPIDKFLKNLDARTAQEVANKKAEASLYEELLAFCIMMNFFGILVGSFLLHKSLKFITAQSSERIFDDLEQ